MASGKRTPRLDLNPSAADRWITCTASPRFVLANADKLPPDDGTKFSKEGTTAHEVAAAMLLDREPVVPEGCPPVDADMLWHGWNYAEYVQGLRKPGSILLVEQKLPLWYMPGRNCIVDAGIINPQDIHIVDFKYGEGVPVHPENNLQEVIYVKSVVEKHVGPLGHEFPVFLHIHQPRGRNATDSPFHVWKTTWGEIQKIAGKIENHAMVIQNAEPAGGVFLEFKPSEKACQWCPAKGFCSARQAELGKYLPALSEIEPRLEPFPSAGTVSAKQLANILRHKEQIVKWLNDAEAYALQLMKGGGKIPGFKLVTSRGGNRYWTNPKAAARALLKTILKREEVIEEKVIGPAAAEKLLGKHKFGAELVNLIAKPPGQPCIATEDDPRESCMLENAVGEFDDVTDDIFN